MENPLKYPLVYAMAILLFAAAAHARYYDDDDDDYYSGGRASRARSSDEVRFGIRAGLNLSRMEYSPNYDYSYSGDDSYEADYARYTSSGVGFQVGAAMDIMISEFLYFQPGAMLATKGWKQNVLSLKQIPSYYASKNKTAFSLLYLDIPLLLSLKGSLDGDWALRVSAGPCIGIGLSGTYKEEDWWRYEKYGSASHDSYKVDDVFSPSLEDKEHFGSFGRLNFGIVMGVGIEYGNMYFGVSWNTGLTNLEGEDEMKDKYVHSASFDIGYYF